MSQDIIPEALRWLNMTGLNIKEEKFYLRGYIMIAISSVVFIMEILQICFNYDNIDVFGGVIEVAAPVYLSLIKILAMALYRENFSYITKEISLFWSTDRFNAKQRKHLERIFVIVKTMLQSYRWLAIVTTTMIITLKPVLTGKGGLPIDMWQPVNLLVSPGYEIIYVLQSFVGYFASFVNIAVDSLYVGYMTHLITQFILLKEAMKTIDMKNVDTPREEEICWIEMKKCIVYHNHLLRMIEQIQKSHSLIFMSMFVTCALTLCIDLYFVAYDGTLDILRIIKYMFQGSFFVFLLFAYCFTGNQLTHQCLGVSDSVYETDWYHKPLLRVRGGVILVILRAQKVMHLSAGGLMTLDLENFIKVLRLAFSFYTLITSQSAKNK